MLLPLSLPALYALRATAFLSTCSRDRWVPARTLAEATGVPGAFLSKVLRRLVEARVLEAMKGHHGGFRLARPAGDILFSDVIRAMGEPGLRPLGAAPDPACDIDPFLHELAARIDTWARERTLADVATRSATPVSPYAEAG